MEDVDDRSCKAPFTRPTFLWQISCLQMFFDNVKSGIFVIFYKYFLTKHIVFCLNKDENWFASPFCISQNYWREMIT